MEKTKIGKDYYKGLKKNLYKMLNEKITNPELIKNCMKHYTINGVYSYSFFNSLLIAMQGGTIAQGFQRWKKLGRHVKAGEKARVYIYVPFIRKRKQKLNDKDNDTEEETEILTGFSVKPVFDISQTSGKELEYMHNSEGGVGTTFKNLSEYAEKEGFKVNLIELQKARGNTDGKTINISKFSNETDKIKTLFHELGHCFFKHMESDKNRSGCETEAELFAYVMMNMFNHDYTLSQAYISNWSDKDNQVNINKILKTCEKVYNNLNT